MGAALMVRKGNHPGEDRQGAAPGRRTQIASRPDSHWLTQSTRSPRFSGTHQGVEWGSGAGLVGRGGTEIGGGGVGLGVGAAGTGSSAGAGFVGVGTGLGAVGSAGFGTGSRFPDNFERNTFADSGLSSHCRTPCGQ